MLTTYSATAQDTRQHTTPWLRLTTGSLQLSHALAPWQNHHLIQKATLPVIAALGDTDLGIYEMLSALSIFFYLIFPVVPFSFFLFPYMIIAM